MPCTLVGRQGRDAAHRRDARRASEERPGAVGRSDERTRFSFAKSDDDHSSKGRDGANRGDARRASQERPGAVRRSDERTRSSFAKSDDDRSSKGRVGCETSEKKGGVAP
jgi:hypothetical protein